jgi:hypothetical protein
MTGTPLDMVFVSPLDFRTRIGLLLLGLGRRPVASALESEDSWSTSSSIGCGAFARFLADERVIGPV